MNFAALLECVALVAFLVIMGGGRQKREQGWKVLVGLLVLIGLAQCFAMSTVVRILLVLGFRSMVSIMGNGLTIAVISLRLRQPVQGRMDIGLGIYVVHV